MPVKRVFREKQPLFFLADRCRCDERPRRSSAQGLTKSNYLYIHALYRLGCRVMTDKSKKLAAEAIGSCLSTRLRLATRVVTKVYDDALRPFGLTASQMSLLAMAASCDVLR